VKKDFVKQPNISSEQAQSKEGILKNYICWAQDQDICDQCVRPWHDGLCTCENCNNGINP
jgi:hypothetical protein